MDDAEEEEEEEESTGPSSDELKVQVCGRCRSGLLFLHMILVFSTAEI